MTVEDTRRDLAELLRRGNVGAAAALAVEAGWTLAQFGQVVAYIERNKLTDPSQRNVAAESARITRLFGDKEGGKP